ncbi:MAG: argD [Bacteroidetes bacterium]|jgi:adenosylmethionine-8-amino-7-oxononanoate aminotransferase|nr:argD [Bacteroidota bacterium]
MAIRQSDKKYLAGSEEALPLEIKNSKGSYIYDINDKMYIDFLSGWCVGNVGWGNNVLKKAIQEYEGPAYVYPGLSYKPWEDLAQLLAEISPGKLSKSFRTTGGSESVDTALQIAMAYTGRKRFLSLENSYHGNIISSLSIGSSETVDKVNNHLQGCDRVGLPLDEKTLKKIETSLKKKTVAAFIMEPVICNMGVVIPENKFMQDLERLCRKYGTLMIIDEVATGFGRTGKLFASEHFGIEPDIMCISKAITGGYAGLGATVTTEKIEKAVRDKVNIYSTYGWHPLSVHVALTNIRHLKKNNILENVNYLSNIFSEALSSMKFKSKEEIRIIGLAIAVDLGDSRYAEKIRKKCLKEGLLLGIQEKSIVLFPALNMEEKTAREGLGILEKCL